MEHDFRAEREAVVFQELGISWFVHIDSRTECKGPTATVGVGGASLAGNLMRRGWQLSAPDPCVDHGVPFKWLLGGTCSSRIKLA
jgi:hypothetical protein